VASTVQSLVAVSTAASLSGVSIPVGNLVAANTVANLSAVNIPVGSYGRGEYSERGSYGEYRD
jgi:hypothetical protein